MIENPDKVLGVIEGKEAKPPSWEKFFIFGGTDSKITNHSCYYEGKVAYEKLEDHVILAQITIDKDDPNKKGDTYKNIENTPIIEKVSPLKTREILSNNKKIWRFINLFKFESLINSQSLYFARIDQFKDNLEGISSFSSIKAILNDTQKNQIQKDEALKLYTIRMNNNRKCCYACCWHINDNINFELWDEYGGGSTEYIAIQTNFKKLNRNLEKTGMPVLNEPITYFEEPYFNQNSYWFPTLFKRLKYEYESELRSLLMIYGFEQISLSIPINLEDFISKIYVHPKASKVFFKKIRLFIKDKGLKIPVRQVRRNQ